MSTLYHTIPTFKGGYLDFSHLSELKSIYITEIYIKKKKNHQELRIKKYKTKFFDGGSLKRLRSVLSYF